MSQSLDLQKDIANYLGSHAEFQYVPVIRMWADENTGDALLLDFVETHLRGEVPKNGRYGLCCVIGAPVSKTTAENSPGPVQDYEVVIECVEHIGNNKSDDYGTGIRADDLAETVKRLLHLWCHDGCHEVIVVSCEQDMGLEPHLRGWLVGIRSVAHALQPYPNVSRVSAEVAAGVMTLACATAGAALYYTLDGSYPSPANAAALLYSAPVNVSTQPAGTLVRLAGYAASKRGSDCSSFLL